MADSGTYVDDAANAVSWRIPFGGKARSESGENLPEPTFVDVSRPTIPVRCTQCQLLRLETFVSDSSQKNESKSGRSTDYDFDVKSLINGVFRLCRSYGPKEGHHDHSRMRWTFLPCVATS